MELSEDAVREFQALYRAMVGVDLTDEEARNAAMEVLALVKLIHRLD